ncbi:hypothetical protein JL722_5791 [Aureococcus anophagefferens]|nr:hypothetical protein JL722_5791 [Aureococcus anophagefferens]
MAEIKVRRSASQRGGLDRGGSFRQPGQPGGIERRSTQQLLETIRHLQEESSDDVAAELSQSKHSMAMVQFIVYWVFLMIVFAAVKEPLLQNEIYANVFFENAMNADQMYQVLKQLMIPHTFASKYWSGKVFSPNDKQRVRRAERLRRVDGRTGRARVAPRTRGGPRASTLIPGGPRYKYRAQYTSETLLALGRSSPTAYEDKGARAACFGGYAAEHQDEDDWTLEDPETGDELSLKYKAYSDGRAWESPFSKVWYGEGGQVYDLEIGKRQATANLEALRRAGFVDNRTRCVFADMTWYNPNVDMFTNARVAFEFLPSGKMHPTLSVDSAPLLYDARALNMDGYGFADLCAVLMEFALYGGAIWFLARVSEDVTDYASLKGYLSVGWNVMDVLSVACFLVVMVLRAMWMLRMMSDSVNEYEEHIDTDEHADDEKFGPFSFDVYMRLRLTFQYYRYCRNFLATGVLITFIKAFKFLSVSKQLSQFTETIYVVSSEMLSVVLILAIILVGHAVAFHISLGHAIAGYRTFFDSMMTLTLAIFGDFDLEEIIAVAPTSGLAMMISYIVVMTFVILTMFLKIIDVSYSAVMERIAGDDDDNFTRDLRDALARIAYDLYWSVMIRLTLLRARYALLFHRPDGDRPALVVDDGSAAGFAAPGKRSLAEKLAARDSARTLAALPEPDDDGDAQTPVDDRTELQRALDKRERHVEKHGRAFDAAAERALLVDHFVAEHRDVAEADAPRTTGARAKSATFQSPVVALLDQPSLVSALTDPRDPTPAGAAGAAPPAIQEELDVLSVVSAGSQRTVVTHDGDGPPAGV